MSCLNIVYKKSTLTNLLENLLPLNTIYINQNDFNERFNGWSKQTVICNVMCFNNIKCICDLLGCIIWCFVLKSDVIIILDHYCGAYVSSYFSEHFYLIVILHLSLHSTLTSFTSLWIKASLLCRNTRTYSSYTGHGSFTYCVPLRTGFIKSFLWK